MSADQSAAHDSSKIPQAPPLPINKGLQGVRNAAYRIIGLPSRPPSPKLAKVDPILPAVGRFAALVPGQDATISHRTGLEINTLSINDQGTHALIGGKEIFKTVRVADGVCVEDRNLRTAIRSTPAQASGQIRHVYSIDIADVAWAKGDCGDFVAAATTSGKIILYDLGYAALQGVLLHEHYRQVHKVTFNPHRGSLLLSGSQDGTVRLWDVRDVRTHASTLQSKRKFSGQSDGVRDVKWSPTEGVDFAFGTDSGWIQRWDIRNLKVPKIRIPAHTATCTSLDWHPDGKHLLSSGIDKVMRIWDFTGQRTHKATWEVRTPYPISNARWRPACESTIPQDNGTRLCTQIATAYRDHPVVHIWDLRRSSLPFRLLTPYASAPTDMLWHSQDLLWTVGKEGIFQQSDVQHVPKPIDRRNLQSVAVAADGCTTFAVQARHLKPTPRHHSLPKLQTPASSLSQSPETIQLSRSWADDSLDQSFLSFHGSRRSSQVRFGSKASKVISTPPSGMRKELVKRLDDVLLHRQSFTPPQAVFSLFSQLNIDKRTRGQLENAYMTALNDTGSSASLSGRLQIVIEQYAQAAGNAGQHRLAQTWRIVSFSFSRYLEKRLDNAKSAVTKTLPAHAFEHMVEDILDHITSPSPSSLNSPSSAHPVHPIAKALALTESTSNVPTPLAKAQSHDMSGQRVNGHQQLPDVDAGHDLDPLPPSLTSKAIPVQAQPTDHVSRPLDIEHVPSAASRGLNRTPSRPPLVKHDSDESFTFMIGSQSSQSESPSSRASLDGPASLVQERPSRPVLKINSGSLPASELDIALKNSVESQDNLEPSYPPVFPEERMLDAEQATSVQGSRELIKQPDFQHVEITALRATAKLDVEEEEPFAVGEMLQELINYYTEALPTAQTAAYMLLTLAPVLPQTRPPDFATLKATLAAYADLMLAGGFALDDIAATLSGPLRHMLLAGLQPLQLESILSTHHDQAQALNNHVAATQLRKLAYPLFASVYAYGLDQDQAYLACGECNQRISSDSIEAVCSSCAQQRVACAICMCLDSPFDNPIRGDLRVYCLLCAHSTHVGCSVEWFRHTAGRRCPTEGCLCTCPATV